MREEYDFSKAKKNPYAAKTKKQVTINIDCSVIEYFKEEAQNTGVPYQVLINLYLKDCVVKKKKFAPTWA